MASRPGPRLRLVVAATAAAAGVSLGLLVVFFVRGGNGELAEYRPFFAGTVDRRNEAIMEGGPVFIPDPTGGERAFYLDREAGKIVALHVVRPDNVVRPGTDGPCLVQYDRGRYTDCDGRVVEKGELARFPVTITPRGDEEAIYVDLRRLLPPPGTG